MRENIKGKNTKFWQLLSSIFHVIKRFGKLYFNKLVARLQKVKLNSQNAAVKQHQERKISDGM